jgi:nucleoside 2-deoxyribosyltransferase
VKRPKVLVGSSAEGLSARAIQQNLDHHAGSAFMAMPIDSDDDQLVDVLEAIKTAAAECGITAERIDEVESNQRITNRILGSICKAEFVIVDLTNERPNVFFEAGFAHGLGKLPIYVARAGTTIHFDIKDYPIITFRNMKQLKEGITKRLTALTGERTQQ